MCWSAVAAESRGCGWRRLAGSRALPSVRGFGAGRRGKLVFVYVCVLGIGDYGRQLAGVCGVGNEGLLGLVGDQESAENGLEFNVLSTPLHESVLTTKYNVADFIGL